MKVRSGRAKSGSQVDHGAILLLALLISLSAHAILLSTRFVAPQTVRLKPADSALEIVLVNTRSASKPVRAKARAQADLNGGGQNERGRSASFLPKSPKANDRESLKESSAAIASAVDPRSMLSATVPTPATAAPNSSVSTNRKAPTGPLDLSESIHAVARMEAQIERRLEDYSERPRRGFIGPSTKGVSYAMYYNQWKEKIERVGTVNYPEEARGKIYGDLSLAVTLNPDGTIHKDQVTVTRSSGYPVLDKAAVRIVRLAAPYGQFSDEMRREYDVFEITTRFSFTKGDAFEANMQRN